MMEQGFIIYFWDAIFQNMLDTSVTHFLLTKQSLIYLHNFTFPDLLFNLNRCGISELCFTILPIFVMHSLFGPSIFLCLFFFSLPPVVKGLILYCLC